MAVPAWRKNVYVLRGISVKIVKVKLAYIYMGVNIWKKKHDEVLFNDNNNDNLILMIQYTV